MTRSRSADRKAALAKVLSAIAGLDKQSKRKVLEQAADRAGLGVLPVGPPMSQRTLPPRGVDARRLPATGVRSIVSGGAPGSGKKR